MLNKETIELIQDFANKLPLDDCPCMTGAIFALTNPEIIKAAKLYTQEEMDKIRDEAYIKGGLDGINLTKENL